MIVATVASLLVADAATAQPRNYGAGQQQAGNHYYNGRWVDDREWGRHGHEQDRWANRRRDHDNSGSSALLGGIIGFALGAAIVGSQQQADHARGADQSWDSYCAKKYRSYDRSSRTYMGYDGVRHYCQ